MHTFRFIVGLASIGIAFIISRIFNIDLMNVMAGAAFILTVDQLTVKFIAALYMRAVAEQMRQLKGRGPDDDNSSSH